MHYPWPKEHSNVSNRIAGPASDPLSDPSLKMQAHDKAAFEFQVWNGFRKKGGPIIRVPPAGEPEISVT